MSHVHAFPCICSFFSICLLYLKCIWDFSNCLLSLSLASSIYVSLFLWHPNKNPLCPGTLFVLGYPLLLTLLHLITGSVMRRPNRTSLRTFLDEAFILNAKSSCRISPTLTFLLSSTVGDGGHYVIPWSLARPC